MIAYFNNFEIKMTKATAFACAHAGQCLPQVQVCIALNLISRPRKCSPAALKSELKGYGAWEENELENDKDNWERIVWIAAGQIKEELHAKNKS